MNLDQIWAACWEISVHFWEVKKRVVNFGKFAKFTARYNCPERGGQATSPPGVRLVVGAGAPLCGVDDLASMEVNEAGVLLERVEYFQRKCVLKLG